MHIQLIAIALYMIDHVRQVRVEYSAHGFQAWIDAYRHWAIGLGRYSHRWTSFLEYQR